MISRAVMQPYFLPYLGYFSLIDSVDHFMFFDDIQYVRKSWMGRNRLLNLQTGTPFYIRPGIIKPTYQAPLPSVELEQSEDWKNKIIDQTATYKNDAPFYTETRNLLEEILNQDFQYLAEFNIASIIKIAEELELNTHFEKYSDFNFWFDEKPTPGTWGREIVKAVDTDTYINAPGGESFITSEGFSEAGIRLGFIQPVIAPYEQKENDFVSHLSIVDVLFFNGLSKTREAIKNYKVKWANSGVVEEALSQ